jgi:tRNA(Ile)-lysidine synthase
MSALPERFRVHVASARLFPRPGTAIIAVSGGPDSVALLDLLHATAAAWGLDLVVAHADHGIQAGSAVVARSVGDLAAHLNLPFELGELRLGAGTSETAARRARYAWLHDVQRRRGARYVVTAHHADDQIETVLLRVLRGSGPAGLAAMAPRSRGGLVRPLLPFTREELRAFAVARGLPVHDDPANLDPRHLRSWVRTALLPLIAARLGPRSRADLTRVARSAATDRRAWDRALELVPDLGVHISRGGFDVVRGVLARYDDALAVALLRAAARRAGLVLGPTRARRLLALVAGPSGRRVELGQGWIGEAAFDRLHVSHRKQAAGPTPVVAGEDEGRARFGAFALRWRPEQAPGRIDRAAWTTWLAGSGWEVRPLATGDAVRPLGGVGRRPVRRLLMEARVPRGERAAYPVLARGATILWVPGVCRSADELPAPGTQAVRVDVIGGTAGA